MSIVAMPNALNVEICEALGLPIRDLVRVTIELEPYELPKVTAVYALHDSKAFGRARSFTLNPKEA